MSHELDCLVNPRLRVVPGGQRVSRGTLYDAMQQAFPGAPIWRCSRPWGRALLAAEVWISTAEELYCRVYVNPYSGVVQGKMTS